MQYYSIHVLLAAIFLSFILTWYIMHYLFKTTGVHYPGLFGAMSSDVVRDALAAAAARARRLAELNSATTRMERLLNVGLFPEMLPWGSAM